MNPMDEGLDRLMRAIDAVNELANQINHITQGDNRK